MTMDRQCAISCSGKRTMTNRPSFDAYSGAALALEAIRIALSKAGAGDREHFQQELQKALWQEQARLCLKAEACLTNTRQSAS